MGGNKWVKEKNLDKEGEGAGYQEECSETANLLSGTHSAAEESRAFSLWLADFGSQMRQRRGSPAGPTEVAAPGTAFPAAAAKQRDKSHPRLRPPNPSCSGSEASLEKQAEGRGNPSFWGLPTGVCGRGRSRLRKDEGGAVLPL